MSQACKLLQVSKETMRRHEKKGLIKSYRTLGGHRRYNKMDINKILGVEEDKIIEIIKQKIDKATDKELQESLKIIEKKLKEFKK